MNIVKHPDPRLRQVCTEITGDELARGYIDGYQDTLLSLGEEMLRTCQQAKGIGLAGPQVGIMRRILVIALSGQQHILVNPIITSSHGKQGDREGCLSYPGRRIYVERKRMVRVHAFTDVYREGFTAWEPMDFKFSNLMARVFQHELDHLNGICKVGPPEKVVATFDGVAA